MRVSVVQVEPVFLDKLATYRKLESMIRGTAALGANLITWGETLIPGYPQWLSETGGAKFDDPVQKGLYQMYWENSVEITYPMGSSQSDPVITGLQEVAKELDVWLIGGVTEKGSSGSTYATIIYISPEGGLVQRHRKIKPTYEERLVWADGDGEGLNVVQMFGTKVGALNCWENWIPRLRAHLHDRGEMVHVSVWPGSDQLTKDIARFMALEGRSYIIAASGLLTKGAFDHLPETPVWEHMRTKTWQNGGSVIIDPRGNLIAGPLLNKEGIISADVEIGRVVQERHNFDYSGHYSRPDII